MILERTIEGIGRVFDLATLDALESAITARRAQLIRASIPPGSGVEFPLGDTVVRGRVFDNSPGKMIGVRSTDGIPYRVQPDRLTPIPGTGPTTCRS